MNSNKTSAVSEKHCFVLIASGKDNEYLKKGTLIAIKSLRITNPGIPVVILHSDLNLEQQNLFSDVILKKINPLKMRLSKYSKSIRPDIPESVFLSLCVELLDDFEIAIYIDADIVVLESIKELFSFKQPLGVRVMDDFPLIEHYKNGSKILKKEQIDLNFKRINNGVVIYNLSYWRSYGLIKNAIMLYNKYGHESFNFSDQSLLNLIAYKTMTLTPIDRVYNFCRWPDMLSMKHSLTQNNSGYTAPIIDEEIVKIVHWNGPIKPWSPEIKKIDNYHVAMCMDCYEQFLL